jgi:regulator of protease activity HflC (stomatin/prohibitin superfamily)
MLFAYLLFLIAFCITVVRFPLAIIVSPLLILVPLGFMIVYPNISRVLVLFGKYKGTVRQDGFWWVNPFLAKHKVSVRIHNFDGSTLKVNDLTGNPIEIAAVIVWRVDDTAKAQFDVEDYKHYVLVQSDAAVRQLASRHPYDDFQVEGVTTTLRGSTEELSEELKQILSSRLEEAGVSVLEARLNHLAYAPEIASAMLQRQQASAIVAARETIVDGAVGMVDMALKRLGEDNVLQLDEEAKARLVGNLLVVLCGQHSAEPVIQTGN